LRGKARDWARCPETVLELVGRAIALDRRGALAPPRWLPDPATRISIARRLIDAWTTRQADG